MKRILGILHDLEGTPRQMATMRAALARDGADIIEWTEGPIWLGNSQSRFEEPHCRPSLIFDGDAGCTLVADARIDDRDGLCDELGIPYPERPAMSDGDLILMAYGRWGEDSPNHLLGDYAFVVWNRRQRTLYCARDHIGARPFYYALTPKGFVFGSEVEAVVSAPGVSDELDESTVAAHLTQISVRTTTRTFFKMIRKLPPGHSLSIEAVPSARPLMRLERWWRPEQAPRVRLAGDDAYAAEFLDIYSRAVKDRLRGGPVGVHLSGGLDSSSIAVLAARELRSRGLPPPPAFSRLRPLGDSPPPATHIPQYACIDAVCAQEGLRVYHCLTFDSNDIVASALRLRTGFPRSNIVERWLQRQAADLGVRVLLSGLGGDECVSFSGEGHLAYLLLCGRWRKLAAEYRMCGGNPLLFLARIALRLVHPKLPARLTRWREGGRPDPVPGGRWFINPAFARRVRPLPHRTHRSIGVRRVQLRYLRMGYLDMMLEGYAATRHDIEYRYPLLDRRLLEFAIGLPAEQFRRGPWGRWLMRHALRSVLPPEICWKPNKDNPAQADPVVEALMGAFPALRQRIAARAETMSRARYVDIPRLLEHLTPARFPVKTGFTPVSKALAFLDL